MKLNHLNLTVSNVLETHRLLEKHFGLKSYGSMEPREAMSFLSDDNGAVLALFRGSAVNYPPGLPDPSEVAIDVILPSRKPFPQF